MFNTYIDGNTKNAEKINLELSEINKLLFIDTNPIPIKYAMSKLGLCHNSLRLPLCSLDEEKSLIAKFGEGATKSGATLKGIFEKAIGSKKKKKKKEEK